MLATFLSGAASLVNQVVWQRAVKIFLAGSESLSAMIVVLVFLLGLGLGSYAAARLATRVRSALVAYALVELALVAMNLLVAWTLSQDLGASVLAAQQAALAVGLPLRAVYALLALALLLPPCFLMGATTPLAAESLQRLGGSAAPQRWVAFLFLANTLGACLGALVAGLALLPWLGQIRSLAVASSGNLLAGLLTLGLRLSAPAREAVAPATGSFLSYRELVTLGCLSGALSLVYEMLLLRTLAMAWQPLPYTFAIGLSGYLLLWALGSGVAAWVPLARLARWMVLGAATLLLLPVALLWDRSGHLPLVLKLLYFLPAFFCGVAYGSLASAAARSWGSDIGVFLTFNTLGSCLGVAGGQLLGYRLPPLSLALVLAAGLVALAAYLMVRHGAYAWLSPSLLGIAVLGMGVALACLLARGPNRAYYGPDGVVELFDRDVVIDGLWHSRLPQEGERDNNFMLAVAPALFHSDETPIRDCLVVGNGIGLTARALAGLGGVQRIDAYEVNKELGRLMRDCGLANPAPVTLYWQDGRSGLALRPQKYDLITSAPLHLKQSGSSLLLSEEYFRLLASRLKPGGVVAVYSRHEVPRQSQLIRETFAKVFPHTESVGGGYLLLGSFEPLSLTPEEYARRLRRPGELYRTLRPDEQQWYPDRPRLEWSGLNATVTDDWPLLEYPAHLDRYFNR